MNIVYVIIYSKHLFCVKTYYFDMITICLYKKTKTILTFKVMVIIILIKNLIKIVHLSREVEGPAL